MIKVILKGGLGNQLFQLAFAVAYSIEHDIKRVELVTNNLAAYSTPRDFELDSWVTDNVVLSSSKFSKIYSNLVSKLFHGVLRLNGSVVISGYFQNVADIERHVKIESYEKSISFLRNQIKHAETISSFDGYRLYHFRGTDFAEFDEVRQQLNDLLRNVVRAEKEIIVSDDKELIRVIRSEIGKIDCEFFENMSSFDMLLSFSSSSQIISNGSTLSWWGAVLGEVEILTNRTNLAQLIKWLRSE